jgi:TetR/AcrR family transcriptional repressor of nem operon
MTITTYREQLLTEGLRIIHERGYGVTAVADIVAAAGAPPEAFAMHFASKEDFGMQMLDIYHANSSQTIAQTLHNDALLPAERLRQYLALNLAHLEYDGMRNGCLYGNLSAEGSEQSGQIRLRIIEIFAETRDALAGCLRAGAEQGQFKPNMEYGELAEFAVASLQGAILLAKAQHNASAFHRFESVFFTMISR